MNKLFSTFTIFSGDMRFIYIGPIMIIIEHLYHKRFPYSIQVGWDSEIWESMR